MKTAMKADLMLLMITAFWGSSCILIKIGLDTVQPFQMVALRFSIAFVLSAIFFRKKLIEINKKTLGYGAILGIIYFTMFIFTTVGLTMTSATKAGFLTCLAGIFIPILNFLLFREKAEKKVIVCLIATTVGVALMTLSGSISFNLGDLLCILCSVLFGFHIIYTSKVTTKVDSVALGVIQLGFVAIYSIIATFIFETPVMPTEQISWVIILILSVFCTALPMIVQTVALKYTSPVHTGLIFSFEPLFAAFFAFVILQEALSFRGYLGGLLMVISLIAVEVDGKELFKKK